MEAASTWEQRTAACFHESGHAVVAHRLGVPVTFASVDDVDGSGVVNTPMSSARADIQVRLAGPAAEGRYCELVRATRREWALRRVQCDEDKVTAFRTATAECGGDPHQGKALIDQLQSQAEAELARSWCRVARFADALAREGKLTGPALDEILNGEV